VAWKVAATDRRLGKTENWWPWWQAAVFLLSVCVEGCHRWSKGKERGKCGRDRRVFKRRSSVVRKTREETLRGRKDVGATGRM